VIKALREPWHLFGFVECDIEGPAAADTEFRPLFVRIDGKLKNPTCAKRVLLFTPYLRVLMTLCNYRVTKVYRFLEFKAGKPFERFVDIAINERQKGTALAPTWKLVANSMYGGLLLNKEKYMTNLYLHEDEDKKWDKLVMSPYFNNMIPLGNNQYNVQMRKKSIVMDTPVQLGKAVLDLAKMRMVQFYYECLQRHQMPIRLISMDTDSFTFAIDHGDDLRANAYDEEEWIKNVEPRWFVADSSDKTPGLFKLETRGVRARVVGKKMMCVSDGKTAVKVACKGIKRSRLPDDPTDVFDEIIRHGKKLRVEFDSFQCNDEGKLLIRPIVRTIKDTVGRRCPGKSESNASVDMASVLNASAVTEMPSEFDASAVTEKPPTEFDVISRNSIGPNSESGGPTGLNRDC